ncbi:MAG: ADP-forming succinate--CoA ligase subunit beta, partial [Planctomycetaceae bacterium]
MKIHEYQGKQLLRAAGVSVPRGLVVKSADDAATAFEELGGEVAIIKSQIHAGGRGKGRFREAPDQSGVVLLRSAEEARENASRMLGNTLVTIQTGEEGKTVKTLFLEEGLDIARELYLGIVIDRETCSPVLIASTEGGMAIEEVAAETPEKIFREAVDISTGLTDQQAREIAEKLELAGTALENAVELFPTLCRFFVESDCSLTEINPLVVTGDGRLMCLDAKVSFDDNAMFRHEDFETLRDLDEEDPAEVRAAEAGLSYVNLDGNIGCLVNGAGLAMSTMDLIKLHG